MDGMGWDSARGTNRILYIEYIQSDLKGLKERRGMLWILPRVGRYSPERNVLYSTVHYSR